MSTTSLIALLVTVAFGGGGLASLIKTFVDRRKNQAETAKTQAEVAKAKADTEASLASAANAIAGAGAQLVGSLLGPAQQQITHLAGELAKATNEVALLRAQVAELSAELERRQKSEESP